MKLGGLYVGMNTKNILRELWIRNLDLTVSFLGIE